MSADLSSIAQNISNMKYYDDDDVNTVKHRINRSISKAEKGQWKKSDSALGSAAICNLYKNNNWDKTKNRYTKTQPIQRIRNEPKSKWHLKAKEIHDILMRIPSKSCGGQCAIENELIVWALKHNATYRFEEAITKLCKTICHKAPTGVFRRLFLFSKGLPIGKPDKNKPNPKHDDDVRPVTICDSIIRIMDKLLTENVPEHIRKKIM